MSGLTNVNQIEVPVQPDLELDSKRPFAERCAVLSSCCGIIGELTLTDSAVIILLAGMLGAGDMFSMITTSVLPLLNGLCVIPMAFLSTRIAGRRKLLVISCWLATLAYFLAASAPFFGKYAVVVLISMIVLFSFCLTGFVSSWFPLLDTFLTKERRTIFLGKMRFFHQLSVVSFLFGVSLVIGKNPSLGVLQGVLFIGAFIFMGRILFVARIPEFPAAAETRTNWREALSATFANKSLFGLSIYQFMVNFAIFGTVPLTILYLKKGLKAPDNIIVFISAGVLAGMLLGYLCAHRIIKRFGLKRTFIFLHLLYIPVNVVLFFVKTPAWSSYAVIISMLVLTGFVIAAFSIVFSSEMMALASPGNKTIDMAFCFTLYNAGSGTARLLSSFLLGTGLLASEWVCFSMNICRYQTLFLLYAVLGTFTLIFLPLVPAVSPPGKNQNVS